jgi:4-alpha-glucanotransferase
MFVLQFEQRPNTREAVGSPPRQSVASVNTHDMPTFAAHWTGSDLKDRASLGLLRPEKLREAANARALLNEHLVKFLRMEGWLKDEPTVESVYQACVKWLCAGPAEVVLLSLEDLWGELEPQNTPGTGPERPNWRRRLKRTLEDIESDAKLAGFLNGLKVVRKNTTLEGA